MSEIRAAVESILDKARECQSLSRDCGVVETPLLKGVIDDLQHQLLHEVEEACESIIEKLDQQSAKQAEEARELAKVYYNDILTPNGQVLGHISVICELPAGCKVIRSYNRQNKVLFEDTALASKCKNYNDMLKAAEEKIQETISKGRLGITTKIPSEDHDDYLDSQYKKMIDGIELTEDEKLPSAFVEEVTKALVDKPAASEAKMPEKQEPRKKAKLAKKSKKAKAAKEDKKGKADEVDAAK